MSLYSCLNLFLSGLKSIWRCSQAFCSTPKGVTYRELKSLLNSKDIMLIDVRNTWEILEQGKIPGSINIPCKWYVFLKGFSCMLNNWLSPKLDWMPWHFLPVDEVGEALQMNPVDFKEKYCQVKPSKSDRLVFSCLAGVRSKKAMDTAISLGFNRCVSEGKTRLGTVYYNMIMTFGRLGL